ncbi:hypothetical protein So717_43140 [Roseobacter cerasinus]|uniref:Uncharacterized protein n=1 Tax=Roseobacter cerasinus TaxID=2602289 RepID=A0A640VZL0_9RHOB|nr:hypothetical protein [Roseobacter cerasinus]GFE52561.1 hypothetical protein So717_43140 [Roseobacter cerasinus]
MDGNIATAPEGNPKPRPSGKAKQQDNGLDHEPRSPALDADELRRHQTRVRANSVGNAMAGAPPGDPPGSDLWEMIKRWLQAQSPTVVLLLIILYTAELAFSTIHASIWNSTLDIPGLDTIDIPWFGQLMAGWGTFSWISLIAGLVTVFLPVIIFTTLFKTRAFDDWSNLFADRNTGVFFAACVVVWLILVVLEFQVFKSNLTTIGQTPPASCQLAGINCPTKTMSPIEMSLISGALMAMNAAIGMATGFMTSKLK